PGQELKLDASGEILVRGANVSAGYWRGADRSGAGDEGGRGAGDVGEMDADGTGGGSGQATNWRGAGDVGEMDGYGTGSGSDQATNWLRTGDMGEMDAEGNIFFKGRKKDVIVTSAGLNIYPDDLEAALNRQPEVNASCVVGVEGPRGPEAVAA